MPTVCGHSQDLIDWAAQKMEVEVVRPSAKAIGIRGDGGEIRGAALYDHFTNWDCHMHVVSDGSGHWASRQFVLEAFRFPFIQCGLQRVTALVQARNAPAIRIARHLGFQREGLMRRARQDDDLLVFGLLRSECKFIPSEYRHD